MDLKTASGGNMSKKKAPKGAFHGSASGSFAQKKKVILENVKHSVDEKDISLSKSGPSGSAYSNVDRCWHNWVNGGSHLGSAATTPKAERVNASAIFGSPLGSSDFTMDDDEIVLLSCLSIFLEKKWIDSKITKTSVEVLVRKFFALNINLSVVKRKSATAKTQFIRKLFFSVNGFGRATTPSKFEGIIRSTFTSEKSMDLAASLAKEKEININSNLKRQKIRSNQAVIIKEIPMNMPKDMIVTAAVVEFAELGQAESLASKWSFLIGKDSVRVTKAVGDRQWKLPIFNGVKLSWARMDLVRCKKYGCFGHSAIKCNTPNIIMLPSSKKSYKKGASEEFHFQLAKLYKKKCVLIFCPAAFGGKSWAQVVLIFKFFGSAHSESGPSLSLYSLLGLSSTSYPESTVFSGLSNCLAVSEIMKKLSFVELVPLASKSSVSPSVVLAPLDSVVDSDITLNNVLASFIFPPVVVMDTATNLSLNSSKILTSKMGGLESKLVALEVSVELVLKKLDRLGLNNLAKQDDAIRWHKDSCNLIKNRFSGVKVFSSGMDSKHCESRVTIVLNDNLACHICKISEISGHLISVHLLFAGKASVMILGLYTGASAGVRFNSDFNENGARHSASFKKCSDLGLLNALSASSRIKKTIDFIFVSNYLLSAVFDGCVGGVLDHFDTDHLAVLIFVGLGGFLDKQLNTLRKLANTDHWKFNFRDSDAAKWECFNECVTANMLLLRDDFTTVKDLSNLNAIIFDCFKNKHLSRFYQLELLIAKIVKALSVGDSLKVAHLVKIWSVLDNIEFSKISGLLDARSNFAEVFKQLSVTEKHYHKAKYIESELAKSASINRAISKHMDDFVSGKENMINSILKCPFCKVVLNHLVLDGNLILEPAEVKAKYASLNYVVDNAFSGVINKIRLGDLCDVVKNLLDSKAAGLSGILSDHISAACNIFDVLRGDNFLVLRDTLIQLSETLAGIVKHAEDLRFCGMVSSEV
ncbi:hypothetical protein G9A89_018085 [Geosiphon pyriformis]|nr:hypothetical protein G9A89_018085 [Geosiphon pyriformis]